MDLKNLKKLALTKKELKAIKASIGGGDCEEGDIMIDKYGLVWVCNVYCAWELADPDGEL